MAENISVGSIEYQYYDKFIDNSNSYPTIDRTIEANNITKYTYYDDLLRAIKDLVNKDPEKVKHYLNQVALPSHVQTFKYKNKSLHTVREFTDNTGKFIKFNRDMVRYFLKFGKFGEDSFTVKVFVDGKKLDEGSYEIHNSINSKTLYVDAQVIGKETEVMVVIDRSYKNDRMAIVAIESAQNNQPVKIEFDLDSIGRHHYSLDNFIIHRLKKGTDTEFKLLRREVDYTIEYTQGKSNSIDVILAPNLSLGEGDCISVLNKLTSVKLSFDVNIRNPIIPLVCESNGINLPFPIENIYETDIYVNGYHITPEHDYTIEWNSDDNTKTPVVKFHLPFPNNSKIEIYTNSEHYSAINVSKQLYTMDEYGYVPLLDSNIPLDPRYLVVYVDNKRVNPENYKVLADSILLIRGVNSINNVDIRSYVPSAAAILELVDTYKENKSELAKYLDSVGYEFFINRYTLLNNLEPLGVKDSILYKLDIQLNKSLTFKNYSDIEYKIIATYNDGSYRDVTNEAFVSYVETAMEGDYEISATYVENGVSLNAFHTVKVTAFETEKTLYDIDIYTNKLLARNAQGEDITYFVQATFHDNTVEDVTQVSGIRTYVEDEFFCIEATYTFLGQVVTKTKKVNIKLIVKTDIDHLVFTSNKSSIFSNEDITFTVIAIYNDGSSRNVTPLTTISELDRNVFGVQTLTATYIYEGIIKTATLDIEIKDGLTTDLDLGIQKLNRIVDTRAILEMYDFGGIEIPTILFSEPIENSLIEIDGFFYFETRIDKFRMALPRDTYITQDVIDEGRVTIYNWRNILVNFETANKNNDNYLEFESSITKEHLLFFNGVNLTFDINPVNNRQVKIRHIEETNKINPHKVTAVSFKSKSGEVVGVGRDYGKSDSIVGKVMFAQDMTDFIIFYNGVRHNYNLSTTKPADVLYNTGDISYVDEEANIMGTALYYGTSKIGHYTDDRLNEINNQLNYSYSQVVKEHRDILDIQQEGQIMFDLDYQPTNDLPTVIVNGVYYNNKDNKGNTYWMVDTHNKKFIWLLTPENFGEDKGIIMKPDWSVIVVYDYVHQTINY